MIRSFISDLVLLSDQANIEFLGMGGFNTAFKIGNYVLKFGTINFYEEINDNQFSNARLCRKVFPLENFMIEISYYLNATKQVNDIFKLYCLIRDNGKKWYDIRLDNIGIVPNDFEHPYKKVSKEGLMMLGILDCFEGRRGTFYIYNEKLLLLLDKKYKISKKSNKNKKLSFVKKRISS